MRAQPPGPRLTLISRLALHRDYGAYLYRLARQYGDVVHVPVGRWTYLINHPDFIREVLITQADHFARVDPPADRPARPDGYLDAARRWLAQQLDQRASIADRVAYARQILFEALRLYPPVKIIQRHALVDYVIGNYTLPAGARLVISPWVMQRDPRYYPEPFRFEPGRWAGETVRPAFTYFPFGEAWSAAAWQTALEQVILDIPQGATA